MKIRNGFVSNSSSSSFTCDICNLNYTGWDACLSDSGMWECENGHTCCEKHLKISPYDEKVTRAYFLSNLSYIEDVDKEKIKNMNSEEFEEYCEENEDYIYEMCYELPAICCPICNFVNIDSDEAIRYLMKKNGLTIDSLTEQIKKEFKNYKEFRKFIKNED